MPNDLCVAYFAQCTCFTDFGCMHWALLLEDFDLYWIWLAYLLKLKFACWFMGELAQ